MGAETDITQRFIENDVRRHYPECQGWKIVSVEGQSGYDQVFRILRRTIKGEEQVVLGFTFAKTVSPKLTEKILGESGSRPENALHIRKALLVPQGTDVSGLVSELLVLRMKKFSYDGSSLVWLNHPQYRFTRVQETRTKTSA